jgi:hypothetical protein
MKRLIEVAPALGRLGLIMVVLVALTLLCFLAAFCFLVALKTIPATILLYPLGALV